MRIYRLRLCCFSPVINLAWTTNRRAENTPRLGKHVARFLPSPELKYLLYVPDPFESTSYASMKFALRYFKPRQKRSQVRNPFRFTQQTLEAQVSLSFPTSTEMDEHIGAGSGSGLNSHHHAILNGVPEIQLLSRESTSIAVSKLGVQYVTALLLLC